MGEMKRANFPMEENKGTLLEQDKYCLGLSGLGRDKHSTELPSSFGSSSSSHNVSSRSSSNSDSSNSRNSSSSSC